jgi:hypothetical protein
MWNLQVHPNRSQCDMTPENRNNPLLDNVTLKRVSASTDKHVGTRAFDLNLAHVSAATDKHANP